MSADVKAEKVHGVRHEHTFLGVCLEATTLQHEQGPTHQIQVFGCAFAVNEQVIDKTLAVLMQACLGQLAHHHVLEYGWHLLEAKWCAREAVQRPIPPEAGKVLGLIVQ